MTRRDVLGKPDLFVHAGLHKTGTTYLQQCVFPRIEGGSFVLGTHRKAFRLIHDFAKATPPVLWSQETLSGLRESGEYKESQRRILSFLSSTFPGSGLILFLREPSRMIKSLYVQYIHQGGSRSFDKWFKEYEAAFYYDELLAEIADMDWGGVLLFDHDQFRRDPRFVVDAIERFTGCRFPGWESTIGHKSNPSVARAGARTLRLANQFLVTYKSPRGSRLLTKIVKLSGLAPLWRIQSGSLRWLNRVGRPVIDEQILRDLRDRHAASWKIALEAIRVNHRRHGLPDRAGGGPERSPEVVSVETGQESEQGPASLPVGQGGVSVTPRCGTTPEGAESDDPAPPAPGQ